MSVIEIIYKANISRCVTISQFKEKRNFFILILLIGREKIIFHQFLEPLKKRFQSSLHR